MKNQFLNSLPFFIAEISGNHNGDIRKAKKLIYHAKKNGADAVKLQTYTPDMMTLKTNKFKIKNGIWKNYNLWELYKKAHTPLQWHKELFDYAKKLKIKIFSTPFSIEGVQFLEKLGVKIYKIASFEMNDSSLLKAVAQTKKPLILSTGLSKFSEIEESVKLVRKYGCKNLTILYCVSNYPSKKNEFNLNNIEIFKKKFNCNVGLSDHSKGSEIACMSIVKGATVIEKHICLKNVKSVDSEFSLGEDEIKKFRADIDNAYSLVDNNLKRSKSEIKNLIFRRSVYAIQDIRKGDVFSPKNIKTFRPNQGLDASYYLKLLNKKSPININKDKVLHKSIKRKLNLK